MGRYFMTRPSVMKPNGQRCSSGSFFVRFYSRDPYPWYQAGVVIDLPKGRERLFQVFQDFIDSAEEHRSEVSQQPV